MQTTDLDGFLGELGRRGASPGHITQFTTPSHDGTPLTANQQFLKSGLNVNVFRTLATLDYDEWKQIDTAVITEARQRMSIVTDLTSRGLVHPLRNVGVMMSQYSRVNSKDRPRVAMSMRSTADRQRLEYDQVQVPIPVIFDEFDIDLRQLQASRNGGEGLDVSNARESALVVSEEIERMVVSGASNIVVSGNVVYGLLTHPNRNTIATSADWGTPANIYPSVIAMIAAAKSDRMHGPWALYLHTDQYVQALSQEGVDRFSNILSRLEEIPGLGVGAIKTSDAVPAGTGILVQLNSNTIDLAIAQNITTIQWEERGGWITNFIVFAVMAPRVKAGSDLRSGVVVHTGI